MAKDGDDVLKFGITVEVDLAPLDVLEQAQEEGEGELETLVQNTGAKLQQEWSDYASQMLHTHLAGYKQAIQDGTEYPFENDRFHFVIINDYNGNSFPNARSFEEGVPPFDLKKMLSTSKAVRMAKDGHRYVIIPFFHTKTQLTAAGIDYNEVRNLNASFFRRGSFPRGSIAHKENPRGTPHHYEPEGWTENALTDMGNVGKRKASWKTSPFERLYRFQLKNNDSEMVTFRTMSEKSDGWQHPGIRAMGIAQTAIEIVRPDFENEVQKIAERILGRVATRV